MMDRKFLKKRAQDLRRIRLAARIQQQYEDIIQVDYHALDLQINSHNEDVLEFTTLPTSRQDDEPAKLFFRECLNLFI